MPEEYVDPEFPEMEIQQEEFLECDKNLETEILSGGFFEEAPIPFKKWKANPPGNCDWCGSSVEWLYDIPDPAPTGEHDSVCETCARNGYTPKYEEILTPDGFREQEADFDSSASSLDASEVSSGMEYPPREAPVVMSQDSGGVLFLPEDDPIQQPVLAEPLDPRLVYTRPVSRRLRHLVCERRGSEYHKPVGLYRPGG